MADSVNGEIVDAQQETALATVKPAGGQLAQSNRVMDMLESMLNSGADTGKMQAIVALYKDLKAMDDKQAFFAAKAELSAELPTIIAKKEVISKGVMMYKYAPLDEIKRVIRPFLKSRGFDIGWNYEVSGTGADCRITAILELTYGGHTQEYRCAARVKVADTRASDLSPAQLDKQARTSAERGALSGAFNLDIDYDDDARVEGDVIDAATAASLKARVEAVGANVTLFLQFAGADTFENIRVGKLDAIEESLSKKEAKAKAKAQETK